MKCWKKLFLTAGVLIMLSILALVAAPPASTIPLNFSHYAGVAPPRQASPELLVQNGHIDGITSCAFNPQGTIIATASKDETAKLWDAKSGKLIATMAGHRWVEDDIPYSSGLYSLAFSPDGSTLATGSSDTTIRLWSVTTGKTVATLKGHKEKITALLFLPDGNTIVSGSEDNSVKFWNVKSGREEGALATEYDVAALAFNPRDRSIAVGTSDGIIIIDGASRKKKSGWAKRKSVKALSFSADGTCLAAVSGTHEITFWDPSSGKETGAYTHEDNQYPVDVKFAARAQVLVSTTYNKVSLWDFKARKPVKSFPVDDCLECLAVSSDGKSLAAGSANQKAYVFDAASGKETAVLEGKSSYITGLAISQKGTLLATGCLDGTSALWDLASGRVARAFTDDSSVFAVALNREGTLFATGYRLGKLKIREAGSGKLLHQIDAHKDGLNAVAFSPDSASIATGGEDKKARIYDVQNGRLRATLGHPGEVTAVAFSPDGKVLTTACTDGRVRQWDIADRKTIIELKPESDSTWKRAWSVAISPGGREFAAGMQDGTAKMWEVGYEEPVKTFNTHTRRAIYGISYSPDGKSIALAMDRLIYVFDVASGKEVCHFEGDRDVIFSANSHVIITGGKDGDVQLWKVPEGTLLGSAFLMDEGKDWVATTPDGLFDGSQKGMKIIEWRIGERMYTLDQFFNEYYTPGLLSKIVTSGRASQAGPGGTPRPAKSFAGLKPPPLVKILTPRSSEKINDTAVSVSVELKEQAGGGISNAGLYLNGKHVADKGKRTGQKIAYRIPVVNGLNRVRATAFNGDGTVESRGDEVAFVAGRQSSSKPTLYVLSIGIDSYSSGLKLQYASKDARSIASFFKPGLFSQVKPLCITDEKAGKKEILGALSKISKEALPQDTLLLYFAGHGVTVGDMFYFLPQDVKVDSEHEIRATSISSLELGQALSEIPATRQVLVIDACQSGGTTHALGSLMLRSDPGGVIKAQQRLARGSGTFLIAASTDEQYAIEVPELGHGILTYAILSGLGSGKKPQAPLNKEGKVTVNALLQYLSRTVPELAEKYKGGSQNIVQFSTGQDFPLVSHK
ncbi:MAG: caspase family protein [Candidatus Eremiobacteraeota bacterium]|nr:caspase family protein [Candidatus Eremiobacteraeota bacterium]